jgi:hypothetical protein
MNFLDKIVFEKIKENPNEPFFIKNAFKYQDIILWEDIENYLNNPYIHINDVEIIDSCGIKFNLNKIYHPYSSNQNIIPSQVFGLINNYYSFVLLNMNRFNKKLNFLAEEIESNVIGNNFLDFHLYCGLGLNSNSFKAHSDRSHNIIMQVDGTSRWKVYSDSFEDSTILPNNLEKNLNVVIDKVISPGDIVYIPAGTVHLCIPQGKRISISSCWNSVESFSDLTVKSFHGERVWHTFDR